MNREQRNLPRIERALEAFSNRSFAHHRMTGVFREFADQGEPIVLKKREFMAKTKPVEGEVFEILLFEDEEVYLNVRDLSRGELCESTFQADNPDISSKTHLMVFPNSGYEISDPHEYALFLLVTNMGIALRNAKPW